MPGMGCRDIERHNMSQIAFPERPVRILSNANIEILFEQVEKWAKSLCEKYVGLVISEDQVKAIRTEMADLNKHKSSLKAACDSVVKELSSPIEKIRGEQKRIESIFESTYATLKQQVDCIADAERQKKEEAVVALIKASLEKHPDLGAIDVQKKWTNKTTSMKSVQADVDAIIAKRLDELKIKELEEQKRAAEKEEERRQWVEQAREAEKKQAESKQAQIPLTPPTDGAEKKEAPATEPEPQGKSTTPVSHSDETTMQIIVSWDASADHEIRLLLRKVREMASSFAARKID